MPTRPITDEFEEITDRQDWFGQDYYGTVLRFMMASTYAISRFYQLYGETPNVFLEGPTRHIATALFGLYKNSGRALAINPGRREKIAYLEREYFNRISDIKERERTISLFMEYLGEVKRNLFYYTSKRDIQTALKYSQTMFAHARAETLLEQIQQADQTDSPEEFVKGVDKAVENYQRKIVEVGRVCEIGSRESYEILRKAYQEVEHPVFTLPARLGPIAEMMNSQFLPTGFISFMGPEKRGKSWWLQELALYSARQVPTLLIQCGDMSTEMVMRRLATRLLKRGYKERYCGEIYIPTLDCMRNRNNSCNKERRCNDVKPNTEYKTPAEFLSNNPDYIPCAECARCGDRAWKPTYWWTKRNPVNPHTYEEAMQAIEKARNNWRGGLYVHEYPNDTLTISQLRSLMDSYIVSGVNIRTIFVDYMDIMAKQKGNSKEFRHFQNELWKSFRGFLQEYNLLGIAATQANTSANSEDCTYIDMGQISEDKRKASHVTAMWGLNQTKEEKQKGIMRINQVVVRDDDYDTRQQIAVLQSLATGQPMIASYIVPGYSENEKD